MARIAEYLWFAFLAGCLVGGGAQTNVTVCVPASQTAAQLANCTADLSGANTAAVRFQCVAGTSVENCFRLLGDGTAILTSAAGEEVFTANLDYHVLPILAEGYPGTDDFTNYYSVAVVNKTFCDGQSNKTLANLKGLRSSHTGYGRTAGWDYAVGSLLASGAMPVVSDRPDVADDAESVASFFSKTCAPRASSGALASNNLPMETSDGLGTQFPPLCTACKGRCNGFDPYWSYEGVVRALTENAADVGFTKHTSFINFTSGGSQAQNWSTRPSSDFRLLCRNGGCANVTDYRSCHLARAPSRAIVATPLLGKPTNGSLFTAIQDALETAAKNATFLRAASRINGLPDVLLSGSANRLTKFNTGVRGFFNKDTLDALKALNQIPNYFNGSGNATYGRLAFCVASEAEQDFCLSVARLLNSTDAGFAWTCRRPANASASCAADVAAGHSDVVVTGAAGLATAYRDYKLRAIAAEDDGTGQAAQYYSVAIVEQSYCSKPEAAEGFKGLAGQGMCATGYGRTAGWVMPIGYLASKGLLNTDNHNTSIAGDAEAAARFFGSMCAAGNTTEGPMKAAGANYTTIYQPLCTSCGTPWRCSQSDRYYDYEGAFRGLVEGACVVAMTKNGIVEDYSTGGRYAQDWAPSRDRYRLLCPDGGCKDVGQYAQCTAAKVPARAVAVRENYGEVRELQAALEAMTRNSEVRSLVFSNASNPQGLLFQASVQRFVPVEVDTPTFLGPAGAAIENVARLNTAASGQPLRAASTSG